MKIIIEENKNKLCIACNGKCWQRDNIAIHSCKYTKEFTEGSKLAKKLMSEYVKK